MFSLEIHPEIKQFPLIFAFHPKKLTVVREGKMDKVRSDNRHRFNQEKFPPDLTRQLMIPRLGLGKIRLNIADLPREDFKNPWIYFPDEISRGAKLRGEKLVRLRISKKIECF